MAIEIAPRLTHENSDMDTSDSDSQGDADDAASLQSDASDTSSEVTQLDHADFPGYFRERHGRLFHSHGGSPYPLPVDAEEQERVNGQHALLFRLLGSNFRGPVRHAVRVQKRVLDLCTGTGQWVLDMARDFPNVRFDGIDIVPIATRIPPDNVYFEMSNVNEPWRYRNGIFDVVHARSVSMAVYDYPGLLDQAARVLRPGGLFLAGEWGRFPALDGGRDPRVAAPRACAFFAAVNEALARRRVLPAAEHLARWLQDSGRFDRISPREYAVPVGDWHPDARMREIGADMRRFLCVYAESMRVLLLEAGRLHQVAVDSLVRGYKEELFSVRGMVCIYYSVHARRLRA